MYRRYEVRDTAQQLIILLKIFSLNTISAPRACQSRVMLHRDFLRLCVFLALNVYPVFDIDAQSNSLPLGHGWSVPFNVFQPSERYSSAW